jgi:hypothetical protein
MKNIMGVILGAALVSACTQTTNLTVGPTNFGAVPQPEVTTLENFESAVTTWTMEAYPNATATKATLSTGAGIDGSKALQLDYQLSCEDSADKSRCAEGMLLQKEISSPTDVKAVSFWINASTNIDIEPRIEDSMGQTFAFGDRIGTQMAEKNGFYRYFLPIDQNYGSWGGPGDRVFRGPIRRIYFFVYYRLGSYSASQGRVLIDQIESWKEIPSVLALDPRKTEVSKLPDDYSELKRRLGVVLNNDWWQNNYQKFAGSLDAIQKMGFSFVRVDASWVGMEKQGVFDFTLLDKLQDEAEKRGLRVLWILDYGHPDHSPFKDFPFTPVSDENFAAYSRFVEALVGHFKGRQVMYEVWNEPEGYSQDDPSWAATDNRIVKRAAWYTKLARGAVTAARRADPNVVISTGGLVGTGLHVHDYLDTMLSGGAADQTDAIAVHLYKAPPERQVAQIARFRNQISAKYAQKVLWETEWGYTSEPTNDPYYRNTFAAGAKHVSYTLRRILVTWAAGLPVTTLFTIQDGSPEDTSLDRTFGLLTFDGQEKPVARAITYLSTLASNKKLIGMLKGLPVGVNGMRLSAPNSTEVQDVIWSEIRDQTLETRVPCNSRVNDVMGQSVTLTACSGENGYQSFTLEEAKGPVYVFSNK